MGSIPLGDAFERFFMFPCCQNCYEKYLKDEPEKPVCLDGLAKLNEKLILQGKEPKDADKLCRCICHVIGITVFH